MTGTSWLRLNLELLHELGKFRRHLPGDCAAFSESFVPCVVLFAASATPPVFLVISPEPFAALGAICFAVAHRSRLAAGATSRLGSDSWELRPCETNEWPILNLPFTPKRAFRVRWFRP